MNFKKITYFLLSVILSVFLALLIFEIFSQLIPVFSKNIPENNNIKYVYILGESSATGTPYRQKISFSKIIQYVSANKIDNKNIEIINIAVPTVRIVHQYYRYLIHRYLHPFDKGIVLVYAGTNDTSFSFPEKKYSFFYNFSLIQIISAYTGKAYDFQYIYELIIKLSKKFGDDIYISTLAGNYAGFMPDKVENLKDNKELTAYLDNIDNLFFEGKYEPALELCKKNIDDSAQQYFFYRMGKIYENQSKIKEANEFYVKAASIQNCDIIRTRPTIYQNRIIKYLALKYNVKCFDLFDKLYNSNEIIGYNFFIDKIHPTITVHIMLAEGFTDLLCEKYKITKINEQLTETQVKKKLNFSEDDVFRAYIQALSEIFVCIYRNGILDRYSLCEIEKYIFILKNLNLIDIKKEEQNETLEFLRKLLEYISNPKDELKGGIKEIYNHSSNKNYFYPINADFKKLLEDNNII